MSSLEDKQPEWFSNALSSPVEVEHLDVNGCRIAFRRWGDRTKPGLVLVHGGRAHSRWWDHIAPLLAGDCSVTALDLSGHGDSGHRAEYTWEDWAQELSAVAAVTSDAPQPPIVVAHSMGGRVSARAANESWSELTGLILIDVSLGPTRAKSAGLRAARPAVGPRIYPTEEDARARFRLEPAQPEVLPYVLDHVARTSIRRVPAGWTWKFDQSQALRLSDIGEETISKIQCHLALLRGEHGRVAPDAGAWYESVLGHPISVAEIPLAYHSVMIDQPLSLVTGVRVLLAEWGHLTPS